MNIVYAAGAAGNDDRLDIYSRSALATVPEALRSHRRYLLVRDGPHGTTLWQPHHTTWQGSVTSSCTWGDYEVACGACNECGFDLAYVRGEGEPCADPAAPGPDPAPMPTPADDGAPSASQQPEPGAKVQWTVNGVDQFPEPKTVRGLSDCGQYVFVEGSDCGLPIDQITIVPESAVHGLAPPGDDIWTMTVKIEGAGNGIGPKPPSAHIIDIKNLPLDLVAMDRWVVWMWKYVFGKPKWDKPPINPHTGAETDATDPRNWMICEDSVRLAPMRGDGSGFQLGTADDRSGFVVLDIDHCVSGGKVSDRAMALVRRFRSYAEFTPTDGIRIWIKAHKPGGRCCTRKHPDEFLRTVEVYDHGRYVTVTGRKLDEAPAEIALGQEALDELYAEMFPAAAPQQADRRKGTPSPVGLSDEALLKKARAAKNGGDFSALFDRGDVSRDGGQGQNSSDLALMNLLAFWTGCDFDRMERLFTLSALGQREKWTGRRDYRYRTVDLAIKGCDTTYEPHFAQLKGRRSNLLERAESPDVRCVYTWPALRLGDLPPAGEFPIDVFPQACVDLAKAISSAVGCDVASVGGSILSIAAGLIGRTAHLKIQENWIVPPIIYHANVADPGQGKTWAQRYLVDGYLREIERELAAAFDAEKKSYHQKCKADKNTHHDRPIPQQLLIDDSTTEALFQALAANPRGLLAVMDELTVLFAGLNQYKGGRGADRAHFLKLWTGSPVTINRVRNEFGEPLRIPFPHLVVSGNIPPDNLGLIRGPNGNDGTLERWIYTYSAWRGKLKASARRSVSDSVLRPWDDIIKALWEQELQPGSGGKPDHPHLLGFDGPGRGEFFSLYDKHVDECNDESFPRHLHGAWSKLETYAGRFALVLHCLHRAAAGIQKFPPVPAIISASAWSLVDYFKGEHKRVLASLQRQRGEMPEGARLHLNWIRNHPGLGTFSESDISSSYSPNKGYDAAMMEDGRLWLAEKNGIRRAPSTARDPSTPGRKPSPVWEIHPDLLTQAHTQGASGHSARSDNSAREPGCDDDLGD
jgi:hypothetical protein